MFCLFIYGSVELHDLVRYSSGKEDVVFLGGALLLAHIDRYSVFGQKVILFLSQSNPLAEFQQVLLEVLDDIVPLADVRSPQRH